MSGEWPQRKGTQMVLFKLDLLGKINVLSKLTGIIYSVCFGIYIVQ